MKKLIDDDTDSDGSIQEKIIDLKNDLVILLERFMNQIDIVELFYNAIKFTTIALYESARHHQDAFKILHMAIDHAILEYNLKTHDRRIA